MTAYEFNQLLAERYKTEPAYRARIDKARADVEAAAEEYRSASAPVLAALEEVGLHFGDLWELVHYPVPYPEAIPVLIEHLTRPYPGRVVEAIGRSLAVPEASPYWEHIRNAYVTASDRKSMEGLAVGLGVSATPDRFDELAAILEDDSRDVSRVLFMSDMLRLDRTRARAIFRRLRDHPLLGVAARSLLSKRA